MADVYCPECSVAETTDGPRVRLCEEHAERDRLAAELAEANERAEASRLAALSMKPTIAYLEKQVSALQADLAVVRGALERAEAAIEIEEMYVRRSR